MTIVRKPAYAGTFYPNDAETLKQTIQSFFANTQVNQPIPKAIIAPHAGYIYSGEIAAAAYACLKNSNNIQRVILLGPSHRYPFYGLAATEADFFETPLGQVAIDRASIDIIEPLSQVHILPAAHDTEHSLEVQLPFLQMVLPNFSLIPLAVGQTNANEVADVLEKLWNGPENLLVISSDLSHYLNYKPAQQLDKKTVEAILNLNATGISPEQACGLLPIAGLLKIAAKKGLTAKLIDLRNSGDTAGPKDQVVGYAAVHFYEKGI